MYRALELRFRVHNSFKIFTSLKYLQLYLLSERDER